MKMPEGWKKLKNLADAFAADPYYHKYKDPETLEEAQALLKEMAEALEKVDESYHTTIQENRKLIGPILKKFREWK